MLSYTYQRRSSTTSTDVVATTEAWNDANGSWDLIATYPIGGTDSEQHTVTHILSSDQISANTKVRFTATGTVPEESTRAIYIDNVQIEMLAGSKDPFGHGTHVAGAIAGNGQGSGGINRGIAMGAGIVSLRVLDENGQGNTSDIIAALDWILQNGTAYGIDVVNLSLGKAVEESAALDPLVQAAEAVWDAGIVVVASAGNYGRDGNFTITSPGNSPKLITVGSLTDEETGEDFSDDYVSSYSSRGPTLFDHFVKPDLVAPGNRVVFPIPAGAKLKQDNPGRVKHDDYGEETYLELSGTSMAAALTSGAVALMLDKDPSLSPDDVKARLMRSARKIAGDITAVGAGVLDIDAALDEIGHVTPARLSHR